MAYRVFQRSLTAGVALAGAGALAFSSVTALPADVYIAAPDAVAAGEPAAVPRVVTTEVEYVALVRSLELLVAGATAAVTQSFGTFNNEIPAIVDHIGIGVPGALWEDPDYLRLSHSLFGNVLFAPVAPLVVGPFTDAVAEVLAEAFPSRGDQIREDLPAAVEYAFARLVGPIISAIGATGAVHQEIYAAGMAGDSPGQWKALLGAPGAIIDGFLNGGYGDISPLITGEVGGDRIAAPGLLTPWGEYPEDRTVTDTFPDLPTQEGESDQLTPTGDDTVFTLVTEQEPEVTVEKSVEKAVPSEDEAVVDEVSEETEPVDAAEETAEETEPVVDEAEVTDPADEVADKTEAADEDKTEGADKTEDTDKTEAAETTKKTAKGENAGNADNADKGGDAAE